MLALHHEPYKCSAATYTHNITIGHLSKPKHFRKHRSYVIKMNLNGGSPTFAFASWKMLGLAALLTHNPTIRRLSRQKLLQPFRCYVLKMNVNAMSTTFAFASCKIHGLCGDMNLKLTYRPSFLAKLIVTRSLLYCKSEHQRSVNNFRTCILDKPGAVC